MGTAHYMAPEAIRSGSSSAAADVWAVGCTMIEMATARRPWSERDFSGPWVALHHIVKSDMTLHSEFLRERSLGHRAAAAAVAGVEPSQASTDEPTDLISVPSPPAPVGPQSSTGVTALVERLGFDSTNGPLPFPTP
eukprot:TRINITY_DN6581_c0_g1_i1.p2 TRINITY_DN6581_c0_g1~~TRINITY_DN6581_c0_g1_i1.p2  ORF type:complete len:137 (+),score=34.93 TRINITY_DN6581_c0_g1_i1:576-986(+)